MEKKVIPYYHHRQPPTLFIRNRQTSFDRLHDLHQGDRFLFLFFIKKGMSAGEIEGSDYQTDAGSPVPAKTRLTTTAIRITTPQFNHPIMANFSGVLGSGATPQHVVGRGSPASLAQQGVRSARTASRQGFQSQAEHRAPQPKLPLAAITPATPDVSSHDGSSES